MFKYSTYHSARLLTVVILWQSIKQWSVVVYQSCTKIFLTDFWGGCTTDNESSSISTARMQTFMPDYKLYCWCFKKDILSVSYDSLRASERIRKLILTLCSIVTSSSFIFLISVSWFYQLIAPFRFQNLLGLWTTSGNSWVDITRSPNENKMHAKRLYLKIHLGRTSD